VRLDDGRLALSPWERDGWITDGWLQSAGQAQAAPWPGDGEGGAGPLACDDYGCVVARSGQIVALARRPEALLDDCRRADLVVSYPRIEQCRNGTPLIGPEALRRAGGLAIWIDDDDVRMLTVREVRGERPWAP
jgi:competence protein ComEC